MQESFLIGQLLGMIVGAAVGTLLVGSIPAVLVYGIQKLRGIDYNGWKVGVYFSALAVLAQLAAGNPLLLCGGLLGLLFVVHLARQ